MADQLKNVIIGIFVLAACGVIIFILLFLHPSVGDEKNTLHARFANVDKITLGTRVTFAGKPVGEVVDITEVEDPRAPRASKDGLVYIYELTLKIDSGIDVFTTDEISSKTSGLLGEKSVAITPLPPPKGQPLVKVTDQILYANESGSVEEALKGLKSISDRFTHTLDDISDILRDVKEQKVVEKVAKTFQNTQDITASLNRPQMWQEVTDNFNEVMLQAKNVATKVGKGEGTVGRVLMKDDLYLKLQSILSKGETLFNDINHYGLLFNLDKGWQRLRARRMNLLFKLQSPQEFRNYFNDEVDQISTSLSRVSMVLQKVDEQDPCGDLIDDPEFTKVYAELLRRVSTIEEELRMYNQQVVDKDVKKTELVDQPNEG